MSPRPTHDESAPASSRAERQAVSEVERLRPPMWILGVAVVGLVASSVLLLGRGRSVDLVGYGLATVVTVLLVATFRAIDSRRRSRPTYVLPAIAQRLPPGVVSWLLLAAGVVIGGIHVWRFAEAVARQ